MKKLQISCVVLSYNGGARIIPTLESCKLQTYVDKDLVIADDASTDEGITVNYIEDWLQTNSQYFKSVQFIKNQQNLGIVANMKNASLQAKGEIIFGLGQGDMCYGPDTFELIAKRINKECPLNNEIPLIWVGYYRSYSLTPHWHPVNSIISLPFQVNKLKNRNAALKALIRGNFIGAPSLVYTKQLFQNYPPIPEEIRDCEDLPLLFYHIKNNIKFGRFDFFIRWYEIGAGISCNPTEIYLKSIKKMNTYIVDNLKNDKKLIKEITEYEYAIKIINMTKHMSFMSKFQAIILNFYYLRFTILNKILNLILTITYIPFFTHKTQKKSGEYFMDIFH